jgi:hypothetical protein
MYWPFYYCALTRAIYPRIKSRLVHWLDYSALSTTPGTACVQLHRRPAQHWAAIDLRIRMRSEFHLEFAVTQSGEERSDQYFRLDYWFYACEGSINWLVWDHFNLITAKIFAWINIITTKLPLYHCLLDSGIQKVTYLHNFIRVSSRGTAVQHSSSEEKWREDSASGKRCRRFSRKKARIILHSVREWKEIQVWDGGAQLGTKLQSERVS